MPVLEVEQDDLVIIIPRDPDNNTQRTKVLVGNRPLGQLTRLTLDVGVDKPARITAEFQELPANGIVTSVRILASRALIAPWLDDPTSGLRRTGPTLWERLDED